MGKIGFIDQPKPIGSEPNHFTALFFFLGLLLDSMRFLNSFFIPFFFYTLGRRVSE